MLLVGAGGAARGTLCALLDENPHRVVLSNRTAEKARALVAELGPHDNLRSRSFNELTGLQFDLVINATAASLEGQVPAIPVSVLNRDSVCYDMMYGAGPSALHGLGSTARCGPHRRWAGHAGRAGGRVVLFVARGAARYARLSEGFTGTNRNKKPC